MFTDLCLLQSGSVIDTVTSHSGHLLHGLQVLDDLGLVEGLDAGKHPGASAGSTLFRYGQVVKFATTVSLAFSGFVFVKDANPLADGFSGVLVVAGDHDDTDSSFTAQSDGGLDLKTGRIQHANNTNKGQVDFVFSELRRFFKIHVIGIHGGIAGGKGQAPEGITAGSISDSLVNDLGTDGGSHGLLVTTDPVMSTPVKDTFGCTLDKHLGSGSNPGWLLGGAIGRHGFAVPGEFQSEVLAPLGLHILPDGLGGFQTASTLVNIEGVQFLSQDNQSGLSGFADLLKSIFVLVEVYKRKSILKLPLDGVFLKIELPIAESLHMMEMVANSSRAK